MKKDSEPSVEASTDPPQEDIDSSDEPVQEDIDSSDEPAQEEVGFSYEQPGRAVEYGDYEQREGDAWYDNYAQDTWNKYFGPPYR